MLCIYIYISRFHSPGAHIYGKPPKTYLSSKKNVLFIVFSEHFELTTLGHFSLIKICPISQVCSHPTLPSVHRIQDSRSKKKTS